jgi:hypothetical protein
MVIILQITNLVNHLESKFHVFVIQKMIVCLLSIVHRFILILCSSSLQQRKCDLLLRDGSHVTFDLDIK